MSGRRAKKELQSVETFEEALREEVSVSHEFDLPLTVLAAGLKGRSEWDADATRRALDSLRVADYRRGDTFEGLVERARAALETQA